MQADMQQIHLSVLIWWHALALTKRIQSSALAQCSSDSAQQNLVRHCYLDGNAKHEAEQQLVLLEQTSADIAVEGVGDVGHQVCDTYRQCV